MQSKMDDSKTRRISQREGWGDDEPQLESHGTSWKQKVPDKEIKCFHITSGDQNCCKDHWYSQYDCTLHLAGSLIYIDKCVHR